MQYCAKKYVKKKWSAKKRFRVTIFALLILVMLIVVYYYKVICPVIVNLSEEKVRSLATTAISEVVGDTMQKEEISYGNIVKVKYGNDMAIDMIEIDSIQANILIREITRGVQDKLDKIDNEGVGISLGTFTGIPFLYGLGPNVDIRLIPVGTVNTKLYSKFITAGINQTLHQLYFEVNAGIGMVLPAKTQNFNTKLEILLCESVIVGKVPEIYLQGGKI